MLEENLMNNLNLGSFNPTPPSKGGPMKSAKGPSPGMGGVKDRPALKPNSGSVGGSSGSGVALKKPVIGSSAASVKGSGLKK